MTPRVAYLGPAGTHSEEALVAGAGTGVRRLARASVPEAVDALRTGDADRAVVPLENSLEGGVGATLDLLAAHGDEVQIVAETLLCIRHHLIAPDGTGLSDVRRVRSHAQALGQSARFLDEQLSEAERIAAPSTAEAVRTAVSVSGEAAIGSALAADLYGGHVIAEAIQDRDDNVTRFAWLARVGESVEPGPGPVKTSIVFWGFNDVSPGALVDVLSTLSERRVNLTRIESRPRRVALGHYMFFADMEGDQREDAVAGALEALRQRVQTLVVLGSYGATAGDETDRDGR